MASLKRYNPKSHSPAIYIPTWLIQISTKLLSNNAKILYGRLSQWANSSGTVYRSLPQLSKEIGTPATTLERHLKELKDCGLIGTYHPQAGGINHYEFYDHSWMHEPINDELIYKSDPPAEVRVPPRRSAGTPPAEVRDINKKEIKEININIIREDDFSNSKQLKPIEYQDTLYPHQIGVTEFQSSAYFEEFWSLYPKKTNKRRAHALWVNGNLDHIKDLIIYKLIQQIAKDSQWKDGYSPNPCNYLSDERWHDEIVKKPKKSSSKALDHDSTEWAKDLSKRLF